MTSFGSAYYHLVPDNDRLMWDRLPMAAAITALVAATLSRARERPGRTAVAASADCARGRKRDVLELERAARWWESELLYRGAILLNSGDYSSGKAFSLPIYLRSGHIRGIRVVRARQGSGNGRSANL